LKYGVRALLFLVIRRKNKKEEEELSDEKSVAFKRGSIVWAVFLNISSMEKP
jgi:hypothetical protein